MPSSKPQVLIRPTLNQMEALRRASKQAGSQALSAFILSTALRAIGYTEPVTVDITSYSEPQDDHAESSFFREQGLYAEKLRAEFPRQHEFLINQKRHGKGYRAMSNKDKYLYLKTRQEESGS